ncbi:MAG: riboflavin biosynthesis protein RibF [Lachnospiraceae bacterium]|nr:riboflavin biosynthesis protein RibF [Lachnospiraceae bacterium]
MTLGKFDGLHRGHQKLLNEIQKLQAEGYYGIVFAISPDDRTALLTSGEKRHMLEEQGMDCMIRCPFVPEILGMKPEEFISDVLIRQLNAKVIVVGTDFRFGYQRRGDVDFLKKMQQKYGYTLRVIEEERHDHRKVSSTWIREALSGADMGLVHDLLGFYFPVEGTVLHGRHLGHQIGIPTINIRPEPYKLLPPPGVYYSDVVIYGRSVVAAPADDVSSDADRRILHGVTNIGYKPTVDGTFLGVETWLYGIEEDLYGCNVRIQLRQFRRPEQKFTSVEELKAQMERDIKSGKEYFSVR